MSDFLSRVESILSGAMNFNPKSRAERLLMKWVGSVGNVEDLKTYDKSSVVAAINEIAESGGGGGLPDAPSDGKTYGRKNGTWSEVQSGGADLFIDIPYADLGATPYTYSEIVAGHNSGKKYRVLAPHHSDTVICPFTNIGVNSSGPLLHFAAIESIDMSPNVRQWNLKIVTLNNNNEKNNYTDVVPIDARGTEIVDVGHYYTSGNVEGALQEMGAKLANIDMTQYYNKTETDNAIAAAIGDAIGGSY